MNYKNILFKTICLSFILFQISCKKENNQKNEEITENESKSVSVQVAETYQTDEKQAADEKLEVKSIIRFSKKYNSPEIWHYEKDVNQGALRNFSQLSNGNLLYFMEEGDGKYNFTPFILLLDKNGKQLFLEKIGDKISKYNPFNSVIADDHNGGFTLYLKKEIKSPGSSGSDNEKMENVLSVWEIEKMSYKNENYTHKSESRSMKDIFLKVFQDKGFSYVRKGDFSLAYLNGKIVVSGTASKPNQSEVPFIAILDRNLKLLKFNSFGDYPETDINTISLNSNHTFYVEGVEDSAADGTYSSTYKRFIINENLKLIEDQSDSKPFSSVYRGPSAPDVEEEDSEESTVRQESETTVKEETQETGSTAVFYLDKFENCHYSIKEKAINSSEIVFEKTRSKDSIALWQVKFVFPKNYEVPFSNSTKGFKRANGDFVFSLFLRDESVKSGILSMAIFIFNKEGRLVRQFETPAYFGLTDFDMKESNGKLITGFISYEANYVNNNWEYPHVFRSITYTLD